MSEGEVWRLPATGATAPRQGSAAPAEAACEHVLAVSERK